jgi:hypothetical protein
VAGDSAGDPRGAGQPVGAEERGTHRLGVHHQVLLPWAKDTPDSPVSKETSKLLDLLSIEWHQNFYALRHVF